MLGLQIPVPGAPQPVDLLATYPLVFGLALAVTLPSSLAWVRAGWRLRLVRLGALVAGDLVVLLSTVPVMPPAEAGAVVGAALLVEAVALAVSLVRDDLAWVAAALLGIVLTLQTAWASVPLYLGVPAGLGVAAVTVGGAAHVMGSPRSARLGRR